jgi:hypothetical protein
MLDAPHDDMPPPPITDKLQSRCKKAAIIWFEIIIVPFNNPTYSAAAAVASAFPTPYPFRRAWLLRMLVMDEQNACAVSQIWYSR